MRWVVSCDRKTKLVEMLEFDNNTHVSIVSPSGLATIASISFEDKSVKELNVDFNLVS